METKTKKGMVTAYCEGCEQTVLFDYTAIGSKKVKLVCSECQETMVLE